MGFTMATHYCGGHAVETKITMGQAQVGCGMEEETQPCESPVIQQKSCCEDEYISMSIEDDFNSNVTSVELNSIFLFTFTYAFFNLQPSVEDKKTVLPDTSPPPLKQSRQVLFQTFLI